MRRRPTIKAIKSKQFYKDIFTVKIKLLRCRTSLYVVLYLSLVRYDKNVKQCLNNDLSHNGTRTAILRVNS